MAVPDSNRVGWTYTDDKANAWNMSAKYEYVSQVNGVPEPKLGGTAALSTQFEFPANWRARRVKFVDVATKAKIRWLICYDQTCDAWMTPGTTLNININGASVACESTGTARGERIKSGTLQSA